MDNDKQQSQLPPQWVYNQEQPPTVPAGPFHASNYPPQPENNQQFPPAPSPYDYDPNLTMDMGNSLGYGQTMDFHASSMPQPTTSIPRIREKRFKELREKRTRNKPARGYPDVEALQQRKASGLLANDSTLIPGKTIIGSLFGKGKATKRGVRPGTPEDWSASGVHGMPGDWSASGVYGASGDWSGSGVHGAPGASGGPYGGPNGPAMAQPYLAPPAVQANGVLVAAGTGAQDTGMIQRVKVARAAFLITGAFMFSSILGLVRTFLFSYVFGATGVSTAYIQAYLIPNLLYTVVAGGALSSAFIPVFTRYAEGLKDEKGAWHIASSALNLAVVVMISLSFVAFLLAPILVPLYTPVVPGFTLADQELTVTLTRIMLLQAIVLGSGVIISSVLNAKQDFTRTAIGTILYNVGLIIGLLPGFFLASHTRTGVSNIAVYSATWSVVLAAALQVGVQIPGLFKVKMRYTFSFDWKHPGVRQIGRQMIPRAINAAMLSFSTVVDRYLLLFLGNIGNPQIVSGLIPEYFQAFSILVLPVSIFGSSVSTAAFPALASYVARERFDRVRSIIMETLRSILFLSIPSSVGLIVLALPIIQVLLEHGTRFTLQNAQLTAVPLAFFALGLPGLAAVEILTRAFYSLRDSKTPVVISVAQFILKIALSIVLINVAVFGLQWGMAALAFSTAVASTIEAVVLFILLYRRIGGFDLRALVSFLGRALVASLGMGVALFIVRNILDRLINTTTSHTLSVSGIFLALIKLLIELGIGSLVFLIIARRLNIEEMESGPVRKILNRLHVAWL